jgi:hypothetical protein
MVYFALNIVPHLLLTLTIKFTLQMSVSALMEANVLYLERVLQAIAEQLPSLWERARDSVPIHLCFLLGKFGYCPN